MEPMPRRWECVRIVGNAAPAALGAIDARRGRGKIDRKRPAVHAIDFAVRAHARPAENHRANSGFSAYSTQWLPPEMARLSDYAQGTALMAEEPGKQMPPMSIVDYAAIDSGVPAPPYVLLICGPDQLSNWDSSDMDAYREKRGRWQQAIVGYLSSVYPGHRRRRGGVVVHTALSVRQYLNAPDGAVYGVRADTAALDLARPGALAAHGGARGLSGVSLCGFPAAIPASFNPPAPAPT